MRPILKLPLARTPLVTAPARAREVAGLAERRKQAVRAIEQTRDAIRSGQLARSGEAAAKELETALTGKPDAGAPGVIRARVVATSVAKEKLPAVPLGGLQVRLKIKEQVVREETTNDAGLVDLEMPDELSQSVYEIEVLAPDCTVLSCQRGRPNEKQPSQVHLFELPRQPNLKPQIERAKPFEQALKLARERAAIARKVAVKALKEQEKRLVTYLEEIDAALTCPPVGGNLTRERAEKLETGSVARPAESPEAIKPGAGGPRTEKKPIAAKPSARPKATKSKTMRRRPGSRGKSQ